MSAVSLADSEYFLLIIDTLSFFAKFRPDQKASVITGEAKEGLYSGKFLIFTRYLKNLTVGLSYCALLTRHLPTILPSSPFW